MYTIEYYKKEKPIMPELDYSPSGNPFSDYIVSTVLERKRDIEETCYNIKSLTIEMDDINKILLDSDLSHLFSLYARVKRLHLKDVDSLMILNNNPINKRYIYEIINCDWMLNKDEEIEDPISLITLKERELKNDYEELEKLDFYNDFDKVYKRNKIENRVALTKYYLDTLYHKYKSDYESNNILKLGKSFIKK